MVQITPGTVPDPCMFAGSTPIGQPQTARLHRNLGNRFSLCEAGHKSKQQTVGGRRSEVVANRESRIENGNSRRRLVVAELSIDLNSNRIPMVRTPLAEHGSWGDLRPPVRRSAGFLQASPLLRGERCDSTRNWRLRRLPFSRKNNDNRGLDGVLPIRSRAGRRPLSASNSSRWNVFFPRSRCSFLSTDYGESSQW